MVQVSVGYLILFLFSTLYSNVYAIKTPDRWIPYKDNNVRCIIGVPREKYKVPHAEFIDDHARTTILWTNKANCTFKAFIYTTSGTPNATGHYDGFIGKVQRNEVDFIFMKIRPDSLPFEPGKPTPPMSGESVIIMSVKNNSLENETIFREVTSFLDLKMTIYTYTLVTLFFIAPVILLFDKFHSENKIKRINKKKPLKNRCIIKNYTSSCYKMYTLLVDQEQFMPSSLTGHTMVLFASLFSLFAVHGILLNTIGADLIVRKEPPVIDTLDDLLESHLQPVVLRKLTEYDLIKNSPPDHPLHKLWLLMQKNITAAVFDVDLEKNDVPFSNFIGLNMRVLNNEIALLLPGQLSLYIHPISCLAQAYDDFYKVATSTHISKEKLAPGYAAVLFSNKIHPYAEKVITYSMRLAFEASLLQGAIQAYTLHTSSYAGDPNIKFDRKAVMCLAGQEKEETEPFRPYKSRDLFKLFEFWALSCYLSSLILLAEILLWKVKVKIDHLRG